mmetsp:Transcript_14675/g.43062  ORF Transcript_14675/g.43062 Transcript_14675/m.43062 type:complete len:88 (-) Transcript_14675:295-558(-)
MDAAHAYLETRPARSRGAEAARTRGNVLKHAPAGLAKVHRVLGRVWRNGHACVRVSLRDGSIHVLPVELVDPVVLLSAERRLDMQRR